MKLIPHRQDDRHGRREYRPPAGTWRVVRTRRPGGNRNERPRWEVHEHPEAHAPWHCHAAFERRRDALVFLDTTAVTPGGESTAVAAATPKRSRYERRTVARPPRPGGPCRRRRERRPPAPVNRRLSGRTSGEPLAPRTAAPSPQPRSLLSGCWGRVRCFWAPERYDRPDSSWDGPATRQYGHAILD